MRVDFKNYYHYGGIITLCVDLKLCCVQVNDFILFYKLKFASCVRQFQILVKNISEDQYSLVSVGLISVNHISRPELTAMLCIILA